LTNATLCPPENLFFLFSNENGTTFLIKKTSFSNLWILTLNILYQVDTLSINSDQIFEKIFKPWKIKISLSYNLKKHPYATELLKEVGTISNFLDFWFRKSYIKNSSNSLLTFICFES
jgi:hypothetical protein